MINSEKIEFWVPFYVKKVPFWSPFCSKLGPLWVPFLQFLGPLEIWVQCTGDMQQIIADVKTVSFGNKTFYKPGIQGNTTVQLCAARVGGEYQRTGMKDAPSW